MSEPSPGVAMRIFRWADAPEFLQALLEAVAPADWTPAWLAWVPEDKFNADGVEEGFGWAEVVRATDAGGSLVIGGKDA